MPSTGDRWQHDHATNWTCTLAGCHNGMSSFK